MNLNLIGVPNSYGCGKLGADKGPDSLRAEGIFGLAQAYHDKVYDLGNLYIPQIREGDKYADHPHLKFLGQVGEINENLAQLSYLAFLDKGFPLILGGDHSLSIGSLAAASKYYGAEELGVIWIDAHGDINTEESSPSGNIHGMPLAISMGYGQEDLVNCFFPGPKIRPENVFIFGARDLDKGEYILAQETGLKLYEMKDIRQGGLGASLEDMMARIREKNLRHIHLSFDIDALDPSLVPGTGTPVAQGFTLAEAQYILERILKENIVKSMDFVELNPLLDLSDTTLGNSMKILRTVFENLDLAAIK